VPYVTQKLAGAEGPFVAVTDFMHAVPDQIHAFIAGDFATLGADDFGFSDSAGRSPPFLQDLMAPHWWFARSVSLLVAQGKSAPGHPAAGNRTFTATTMEVRPGQHHGRVQRAAKASWRFATTGTCSRDKRNRHSPTASRAISGGLRGGDPQRANSADAHSLF
jgi:hypothetical protein